METTFSQRKSHARSGEMNGATKPPLAASTWIGTSISRSTKMSLMALTSSYSPIMNNVRLVRSLKEKTTSICVHTGVSCA